MQNHEQDTSQAMRKCGFCHMRTTKVQISAFVVRCLDSIISLDSIAKFQDSAQTGQHLAWSETPKDTFCRVVAHIVISYSEAD